MSATTDNVPPLQRLIESEAFQAACDTLADAGSLALSAGASVARVSVHAGMSAAALSWRAGAAIASDGPSLAAAGVRLTVHSARDGAALALLVVRDGAGFAVTAAAGARAALAEARALYPRVWIPAPEEHIDAGRWPMPAPWSHTRWTMGPDEPRAPRTKPRRSRDAFNPRGDGPYRTDGHWRSFMRAPPKQPWIPTDQPGGWHPHCHEPKPVQMPTVRVALYHQKSKDFRLYHSFALEADGALDLTAIEELWGLDRVVVFHRGKFEPVETWADPARFGRLFLSPLAVHELRAYGDIPITEDLSEAELAARERRLALRAWTAPLQGEAAALADGWRSFRWGAPAVLLIYALCQLACHLGAARAHVARATMRVESDARWCAADSAGCAHVLARGTLWPAVLGAERAVLDAVGGAPWWAPHLAMGALMLTAVVHVARMNKPRTQVCQ